MEPGATRIIYPGLDTLRALGSIAVVGTHTCFWSGIYGHGLIGSAAQRLEVGVALFFVLSGFLLSQPYFFAAMNSGKHDSAGRYFWKRSLRVLPVYWLTVGVALLALPENRDLGPQRWLDNILLIDIFRNESLPHGLTQMWSLSTEATFYLILPIFMYVIIRLYRASNARESTAVALFLVTTCLGSLAWIAVASADLDQGNAWLRRGLTSYWTWFAAGIGMSYLEAQRQVGRHPDISRFVIGLARLPGVCWLAAGSLFVLASTPLAGPTGLNPATGSEAVTRHLLYLGIAVLIVTPSVFGEPASRYGRTLAHPLARHLGFLSYSLFCCHVVVLELIGDRFGFHLFNSNPWTLFFTVLASSLAVSEVVYRVVEMPAMRLKNVGRRTPVPSREVTATTASS